MGQFEFFSPEMTQRISATKIYTINQTSGTGTSAKVTTLPKSEAKARPCTGLSGCRFSIKCQNVSGDDAYAMARPSGYHARRRSNASLRL